MTTEGSKKVLNTNPRNKARAVTTRFRSPSTNARYTAQLFIENYANLMEEKRTFEPLYSLHDDVPGLINFRKEYLKDMDPTGYKTATRLLENYDHWNRLMSSKWFSDAKKEWDKELAAKLEAEATTYLRSLLTDEEAKNSEKISAAKVLLGKAKATVATKNDNRVGRPSAEDVKGALAEEVRLSKEEQDDLARITGNVVSIVGKK